MILEIHPRSNREGTMTGKFLPDMTDAELVAYSQATNEFETAVGFKKSEFVFYRLVPVTLE